MLCVMERLMVTFQIHSSGGWKLAVRLSCTKIQSIIAAIKLLTLPSTSSLAIAYMIIFLLQQQHFKVQQGRSSLWG